MLKIGPVLTIVACSAGASAGVANLTGMPDFSQHAVSSWQNHCAPTAAADLVYYYAQSFSNLGGPLPPDPIADTHANATIADLAFRMGTTSSGGTTPAGLVAGLDTHLEDTWDGVGGGANWNTVLHEGAVVGGGGLRAAIESAIIGGDGVILLIAWQGGLPADPNYDTPDGYQGENVGPNDPMGTCRRPGRVRQHRTGTYVLNQRSGKQRRHAQLERRGVCVHTYRGSDDIDAVRLDGRRHRNGLRSCHNELYSNTCDIGTRRLRRALCSSPSSLLMTKRMD
ncbi:MAG: hypothetical protein D6695_10360 [Planctomycetota bacterium]|nr:MAG: hypothetical protein D6695_10360 [Planctomycetota bacterium]